MNYQKARHAAASYMTLGTAQLARARRRLYAVHEANRTRSRAQRDMGWLGVVLCVSVGLVELEILVRILT